MSAGRRLEPPRRNGNVFEDSAASPKMGLEAG